MEKSGGKFIVGFKTVILGLCLYILEFLTLPVFGTLQKLQVDAQSFHSDFWEYAGEQPYPIIFALTGIIVVLGAFLMISGWISDRAGKNNRTV